MFQSSKTVNFADPAPRQVTCPICLSRIDWGDLTPFRLDETTGRYVELTIPEEASPEQRRRILRTVSWRCPNPGGEVGIHFLPEAYGQYGPPAVFGFIGASRSGKTHLLAAMIGAIERGELSGYGLTARPVDPGRHRRFVRGKVQPLLEKSAVLGATEERIISFADAFLVGQGAAELRPVALFDVAGEELKEVDDAKRFLEIATGLIFVVDPDQFSDGDLGDQTFNAVLDILKSSEHLDSVSAAIVLNKSDQLRFDEPVAMWLRRADSGLDKEAILRESADVYAYLHSRKAGAWARPFRECGNATLHFASATGSGSTKPDSNGAGFYPRGVRPQRVLAPLLSLMVMTGVVKSPGAGV
jgi:hypothetical protein